MVWGCRGRTVEGGTMGGRVDIRRERGREGERERDKRKGKKGRAEAEIKRDR